MDLVSDLMMVVKMMVRKLLSFNLGMKRRNCEIKVQNLGDFITDFRFLLNLK
jgi:hypothetical protein